MVGVAHLQRVVVKPLVVVFPPPSSRSLIFSIPRVATTIASHSRLSGPNAHSRSPSWNRARRKH